VKSLLRALAIILLAAASNASATATSHYTVSLVESRPLETALGNPNLPTTRDEWIEMIGSAKRSLDFEEYYLSEQPGGALSPVLRALGAAAKRGVQVRLLLDSGMHRTYPMPADSLGKLANVTLRTIDYRRLAGGVQHAKYFVVDGVESFVGSQNLDWRSLEHIHELGVRVRNQSVGAALESVFEADWSAAADTSAAVPAGPADAAWPVTFAQDGATGKLWVGASPQQRTPSAIPWDRDLVVERLRDARREICLQTLTYGVSSYGVTDSTLHKALLAAAARGVHVRLLISDWELGGPGEMTLRALAALPNIEVRISRLPEWSGGYVSFARVEHCKFLVVDSEWLWVGTSNWEPSYFLTTRNVSITVEHRPLALAARKAFESDWSGPTAIVFGPETTIAPRPHGEQH
jgi:phosphatidylserine/phosphatidylglycerophosphate/cardiolipin synthase-like enzyme